MTWSVADCLAIRHRQRATDKRTALGCFCLKLWTYQRPWSMQRHRTVQRTLVPHSQPAAGCTVQLTITIRARCGYIDGEWRLADKRSITIWLVVCVLGSQRWSITPLQSRIPHVVRYSYSKSSGTSDIIEFCLSLITRSKLY